jgi:hypothetical protein
MNEVNAAGREINDEARKIYEKKTTKGIPFAGSKTAAALAKAFEEPVEYNQIDLAEELQNDTGDCINKLAFYDINTVGTDAQAKAIGNVAAAAAAARASRGAGIAADVPADAADAADKLNTGWNNPNMTAAAKAVADTYTLFNIMQVEDGVGVMYDGITAKGTIQLDERAALMASVGTAMVICKILHGAKSKTIYNQAGLEEKLIYLEDIVEYVHDQFGDVITLDKTSNAAFERMTRDQKRNHERHLLKDILQDIVSGTKGPDHGEAVATVNARPNNINGANATVWHPYYFEKIAAMGIVKDESVGKVWATHADAAGKVPQRNDAALLVDGDYVPANYGAGIATMTGDNIYHKVMIATRDVIKGSPRIKISSNLKISVQPVEYQTNAPNPTPVGGKVELKDKTFDVAVVLLSLVAFHVLTYANTAALDFYIKLARKGGLNAARTEVVFDATNNVLTHSVFAPGLFAALRMYGISEKDFDDEMAFQINTNADVKALFVAAHQAYDTEGANKVGAKMFKSEVDTTPEWLIPKEKKLEYEQEFARTKARAAAVTIPNNAVAGTGNGPFGAHNETNPAYFLKNVAAAAASASNKNLAKYARGITQQFGRRRRRSSKRASFGRRKRSSKKKASFGRRKRSSKRKASFGRRKRRVSRKA